MSLFQFCRRKPLHCLGSNSDSVLVVRTAKFGHGDRRPHVGLNEISLGPGPTKNQGSQIQRGRRIPVCCRLAIIPHGRFGILLDAESQQIALCQVGLRLAQNPRTNGLNFGNIALTNVMLGPSTGTKAALTLPNIHTTELD